MHVKSVAIVGGGSAGWMTASYLRHVLPPDVSISLVESSREPTVGVGEATILGIAGFFSSLGLSESEWMPKCEATYKTSIRFEDWAFDKSVYHHPFEVLPSFCGVPAQYLWQRMVADKSTQKSLAEFAMISPSLVKGNLAPVWVDDGGKEHPVVPYAYHFDANKLAAFLRQWATVKGVRHTVGHVEAIDVDQGGVAALRIDGERVIEADCFVDCTGFKSLLVQGALEEPFVSFQDSLLCDRAIAASVPYAPGAAIAPYTTAAAADVGWTWSIPLRERVGAGYVYSSQFISDDQAHAIFCRRFGLGDDASTTRLPMRIGALAQTWVKNTIAIGLSGGFVEPLESTGLAMTWFAVHRLGRVLKKGANPAATRDFNASLREVYDEVRGYIYLHYKLSARRGRFWDACRSSTRCPESVESNLERWRAALPARGDHPVRCRIFQNASWLCLLAGFGHVPKVPETGWGEDRISWEKVHQGFDDWESRRHKATERLSSHQEFLREHRS